jgi:hypothetical protein
MNQRSEFLARRLEAYLERRTLPRGFEGKPQLIDSELSALHRCVDRFAPRQQYEEWFDLFEERLAEDAKTRAWPTEGEVKSAAQAVRAVVPMQSSSSGFTADPLDIAAKRINAGDPVAETYIWGKGHDLLMQRGLVPYDTLQAYRFGSVQSAMSVYRAEALTVMQRRHGGVVAKYFDQISDRGWAA